LEPKDFHEVLRRSRLDIPERTITGALTAEHAYCVGTGLPRGLVLVAIPLPGVEPADVGREPKRGSGPSRADLDPAGSGPNAEPTVACLELASRCPNRSSSRAASL
jgi:hypothetical protein